MELIGTIEKRTRVRVFDEGNFRGYTEYLIESEAGARPAPQAFLVHQQPGWVLPTHFHLEEQFQVVTRGHGTLGQHALGPVTVHYSSREAGYGPLIAGPEGLDYLTLRAVTDPGAWYLPESRERMQRGIRKRHATVGPIELHGTDELEALAAPRADVLILPESEGLAAWLVHIPPNERSEVPEQVASGGRFHVVVGGSLLRSNDELLAPACIWRSGEEPAMLAQAGPHGLQLLVLQYPAAALHMAAQPQSHSPGG